jgi:hypothetical protein
VSNISFRKSVQSPAQSLLGKIGTIGVRLADSTAAAMHEQQRVDRGLQHFQ